MNKYVVYAVITGVLLAGALGYGSVKLKDHYIKQGLDMYHNQCYNVGGYVINEDGTVVMCKPLTQIPKQELDRIPKV